MEKLPTAEALGLFALLHESLPICENPVLPFAGPVYRLLFLRASSNDVRKHFINHPPPTAEVGPWCGLNTEEFA